MANVYGFEYQSPEEIQAAKQAEFAQQASQGDVNAYARQAVFNIFGSPELQKARATQQVLTSALDGMDDDPTRDPLQNEMARAEKIRNSAAKVNPELAIQANDRFLRARQEYEQRERLKVNQGREDEEWAVQQEELSKAKLYAEASQRFAVYEYTQQGGKKAVKLLPKGASLEDLRAAAEQYQKANPNAQIQTGTAAEMLDPNTLFRPASGVNADGSPYNRSFYQDQLKDGFAMNASLVEQQSLIDTIIENPNALNKFTTEIEGDTGSLIEGLGAFARKFGMPDLLPTEGYFKIINDYKVTSNVAQAQVLSAAYKLAKVLDPGGRLSDQDVRMAIDMMIGTGGPNEIMQLMQKRLVQSDLRAEQLRMVGMSNGDQQILAQVEKYYQERPKLEAKLEAFAVNIKKLGQQFTRTTETDAAGSGKGGGGKPDLTVSEDERARAKAILEARDARRNKGG